MSEKTLLEKSKGLTRLINLVKDVFRLFQECIELGITPIGLETFASEITEQMEALPIAEGEFLDRNPMYFILSGGEWWPVHTGVFSEKKDWLNYSIRYKDGTVESGPCQPYYWANCTADGTVCYQWLDMESDDIVMSQPVPRKEIEEFKAELKEVLGE